MFLYEIIGCCSIARNRSFKAISNLELGMQIHSIKPAQSNSALASSERNNDLRSGVNILVLKYIFAEKIEKNANFN
jgi:hypothetical protein